MIIDPRCIALIGTIVLTMMAGCGKKDHKKNEQNEEEAELHEQLDPQTALDNSSLVPTRDSAGNEPTPAIDMTPNPSNTFVRLPALDVQPGYGYDTARLLVFPNAYRGNIEIYAKPEAFVGSGDLGIYALHNLFRYGQYFNSSIDGIGRPKSRDIDKFFEAWGSGQNLSHIVDLQYGAATLRNGTLALSSPPGDKFVQTVGYGATVLFFIKVDYDSTLSWHSPISFNDLANEEGRKKITSTQGRFKMSLHAAQIGGLSTQIEGIVKMSACSERNMKSCFDDYSKIMLFTSTTLRTELEKKPEMVNGKIETHGWSTRTHSLEDFAILGIY